MVSEPAGPLPEASAFEFRTKPGFDDYGECAGVYNLCQDDGLLHGKPVYTNHIAENFLGFNGSQWVLTGLVQKQRLLKVQKQGFKGFHAGGAGEPDDCSWGQYVVLRHPATPLSPFPGAAVLVQGLLSAQELNGTRGTCLEEDASSGRWAVDLGNGLTKLLKADNLLVCGSAEKELLDNVSSATTTVPLQPEPVSRIKDSAPTVTAPAPQFASVPTMDVRPVEEVVQEPEQTADVEGLRLELEEVRKAKALAIKAEDFQFAKELRGCELELEGQLAAAEAATRAAQKAAQQAAEKVAEKVAEKASENVVEKVEKPSRPTEPKMPSTSALQLRDKAMGEASSIRAQKAAELARLYEERRELQESGAEPDATRSLETKLAEAEAAALTALVAEVEDLRAEIQAVGVERQRALRADEEDKLGELDQRRLRLEAKLRRLEEAAGQAAAAVDKLQAQSKAPSRTSTGICAACGAKADARPSPDGLAYCSWCWSWWNSQRPRVVAAAPQQPRETNSFRGGCFWDMRREDEADAGLRRPVAARLSQGASASGGSMRLLAAAPSLTGPIVTEEMAMAMAWKEERTVEKES